LNFANRNVDAHSIRKNSVAPQGQGAGIFWILLWTGVARDVNVGLFVGRNLSKVRRLVFFLKSLRLRPFASRLVLRRIAAQNFLRMAKFSASPTIMLSQQGMKVSAGW
jgi:hypothetical protein